MKTNQHTIAKAVSVSGKGLHTGVSCTMTFCPAPINHGIQFQRIDLPEQPRVPADVDNVVDTSRGTTIAVGEAKVHTVEHTLAALVGLEIDNILIQIDGPEPPIMDGSSIAFLEALESAGLEDQNVPRNFFEVPDGIFYQDAENNIEIAALPLDDYRVTTMVDYNSAVLGSQHAALNNISQFKSEIAECRTFCFLHEIEYLHSQNLIQGGDLGNAIVLVDKVLAPEEMSRIGKLFGMENIEVKEEGVLNNTQLRHKNEPARHKLLDLMGDLALLGRPFKAQILAARPGHKANVAFAKKMKRVLEKTEGSKIPSYNPKSPPVLDVSRIMEVLPHRYPFQLLDKVIYLDDKVVVGVKNVTINEPFFPGHFPNNPVMPGVLQVEAMAQTAAILALSTFEDPENYWTYFAGIDRCRFKRMVKPGDTIVFRCELVAPIKRGLAKIEAKAFVADQLVCEANLLASLVRKDA